MKRWIRLVIRAALLGVVVLVSVSPVNADPNLVTSSRIGRPDAAMTITWLTHPAYSLQTTSPERKAYLEKALTAWAERHPDIKIEPSVFPSNIDEAMTKLLEQAAAGRAPDIVQIDSFFLPRFYPYLQPLDQYLDAGELDDFVSYARDNMVGPDGHVKAFWFTTDVRALFYRKDLVKSPPKTWDELIETAVKLSKQGYVGYLYPGGRGEGNIMVHLPMFWAQGGELVDGKGRPVFNEGHNREAMLNLLRFLRRTVESGASPSRVVNFGSESDLNPEIASGKVAMFLGGNWQIMNIRQLMGEEEAKKWDFALVPTPKGGKQCTTVGGWTLGTFTKDPVKQKAIVDFIKTVYAGKVGMTNWTSVAGYLPTRKSVAREATNAYYQDPAIQAFAAMTEYGRPRPGATIYPTISVELQVAISETIAGRKTPEKALDDAWAKVMQTYESMK